MRTIIIERDWRRRAQWKAREGNRLNAIAHCVKETTYVKRRVTHQATSVAVAEEARAVRQRPALIRRPHESAVEPTKTPPHRPYLLLRHLRRRRSIIILALLLARNRILAQVWTHRLPPNSTVSGGRRPSSNVISRKGSDDTSRYVMGLLHRECLVCISSLHVGLYHISNMKRSCSEENHMPHLILPHAPHTYSFLEPLSIPIAGPISNHRR